MMPDRAVVGGNVNLDAIRKKCVNALNISGGTRTESNGDTDSATEECARKGNEGGYPHPTPDEEGGRVGGAERKAVSQRNNHVDSRAYGKSHKMICGVSYRLNHQQNTAIHNIADGNRAAQENAGGPDHDLGETAHSNFRQNAVNWSEIQECTATGQSFADNFKIFNPSIHKTKDYKEKPLRAASRVSGLPTSNQRELSERSKPRISAVGQQLR